LEQRHHRLAYTGIAAAVALAIGLFALNFPVFLDDYDQWGWQIDCGTGYVSELTQAAAAVGEDYVDECESALLLRRVWTIPLVLLGGAVVLAVLVASASTSARESLVARRDTA
jgi:H+/Cl- antiporter ClcA